MRGKNELCLKLVVLLLLVFVTSNDAGRSNLKRKCINARKVHCTIHQFTCLNGRCISRNSFCDNRNDCGDNSDELYCGKNSKPDCPTNPPFTRCTSSNKCIPDEWICDGVYDCPSREDEKDCELVIKERKGRRRALKWIYDRTFNNSAGLRWDSFLHKAVVSLYLAAKEPVTNSSYFQLNMMKDVSIQFLSRVTQRKLHEVPSTDLAAFVNAMLVTCLNPRQFHGMNLIEELRSRVNNQNYTNPYILLTLCNAGDTITEVDKDKLAETFRSKHREFWADMKAMVIMALSCAAKQPGNTVDEEMMKEFIDDLKAHQYRNGSVENVQTTALVLQALYSADPDEDSENFDEEKAVQRLLASQDTEGSFGSFMETYYVLPVLYCRSLVNISTHHCGSTATERNFWKTLKDLSNRIGPKIRVQYSLWYEDEKDMERTIALRVPASTSFYNIMQIAADIDEIYSFRYLVKNRKPYVNAISNLFDDPETGKFWFIYIIKEGELSPISKSPADVIPKDGDHIVMWYRSGSWVEE